MMRFQGNTAGKVPAHKRLDRERLPNFRPGAPGWGEGQGGLSQRCLRPGNIQILFRRRGPSGEEQTKIIVVGKGRGGTPPTAQQKIWGAPSTPHPQGDPRKGAYSPRARRRRAAAARAVAAGGGAWCRVRSPGAPTAACPRAPPLGTQRSLPPLGPRVAAAPRGAMAPPAAGPGLRLL